MSDFRIIEVLAALDTVCQQRSQ